MSTDAYIRDERFQLQCAAFVDHEKGVKVKREDIPYYLENLDQNTTAMIAQHAQFDGAYLWKYYRWRPAFWIDTLSMSRALRGLRERHSLKELCKFYGLPPKSVDYAGFEGQRYDELSEEAKERQREDCLGDAWRTRIIAMQMLPLMPLEELRIIDMTVRQFTEPQIVGDQELLARLIGDELENKKNLLAGLGVTEADLASDDRFEDILIGEGIKVEYKTSKTKRGVKGCFSVSDEYFKRMLTDSDPHVRAIFEARAAVKSTIQRTRAETFLEMAKDGPMRVYYFYYGARNARFAGGDDTNMQNLPSRGHNGTGLRRALCPPKGYVLVVPDLSQIECRMLVTCAGQFDKIQAFRENRDLYKEAASRAFVIPIKDVDDLQRQCGKVQVLQLGYNAGWKTYLMSVLRMTGVDLGEEVAREHVQSYRDDNARIAGALTNGSRVGGYWQFGEGFLFDLAQGSHCKPHWAPVEDGQEKSSQPLFIIHGQKIVLPNGLMLHFDGLHWGEITYRSAEGKDEKKHAWKLPTVSGYTPFYGGKLIQNINSALARIVLTQAELRVVDRAPWAKIVMHTHDDSAFLCREEFGETLQDIVDEEFTRPPSWLPNIPLSVKSSIRCDYAK
jgi:hypothetical protein